MAYARVKAIPSKKSYKWGARCPIFPNALKILPNEGTRWGDPGCSSRRIGLDETTASL